jgi:hypothetical protein
VTAGSLPAGVKRTPALRRVPLIERIRLQSEPGNEGDVCAFELPSDAAPVEGLRRPEILVLRRAASPQSPAINLFRGADAPV